MSSTTQPLSLTLTISGYVILTGLIVIPMLWLSGGFKLQPARSTTAAPITLNLPSNQSMAPSP